MAGPDPERPWIDDERYDRHPRFVHASPERQRIAREFHDDGFAVLRGAVAPGLVHEVRTEIAAEFARRSSRGDLTDRLTDAWRWSPAAQRLAAHPSIVGVVAFLLGRPVFAFQTLDFGRGTEQRGHADSIHFDTLPAGFMCGAWVALEAVGVDQGPVRVHPGSHRLDQRAAVAAGRRGSGGFDYPAYEQRIAELVGEGALDCTAAAGDVILWASSLVHGGARVLEATSTRWSQVTHYFGHGCTYVTPMHSRPDAGVWAVREPLADAATGRRVRQTPPGPTSRIVWGRRGLATIEAANHQPTFASLVASPTHLAVRHARRAFRDLIVTRWRGNERR